MAITPPNSYRGPFLDLTVPSWGGLEAMYWVTVRNNTTGKSLTLDLATGLILGGGGTGPTGFMLDFENMQLYNPTAVVGCPVGTDHSHLLTAVNPQTLWTPNEPFIPGVANDVEIEVRKVPLTTFENKGAGTYANNAGIGSKAWTTPANAATQNSTYTTAALAAGATSNYLQLNNLGFKLGANAQPVGVQVNLNRKSNALTKVEDNVVSLLVGGVVSGQNKAEVGNDWGAGIQNRNYGGLGKTYGGVPADADALWGLNLSKAQVEAANFGIVLAAKNAGAAERIAEVDLLSIVVFTREPSAAVAAIFGLNPQQLRFERRRF